VVALASPNVDRVARDAQLVSLILDDLLADRPPWAADGLCIEFPGLVVVPDARRTGRRSESDQQKVSRSECAGWALDRADIVGIWGATSSQARSEAPTLGLDVAELLDAVDTRRGASTWETAPCRGCSDMLSRLLRGIQQLLLYCSYERCPREIDRRWRVA
jgi:hypothetical protein